jgi:hypothetical protein
LALVLILAGGALAQSGLCECDHARPETLAARNCSLCREAERHPPDTEIFYLKDNNPRKPNRWLVLARAHGRGPQSLAETPKALRTRLWTAAIQKAKELWGDAWGVAYNGDTVRTQCHLHLHIGKLLPAAVTRRKFVIVNGPAQIPAPKDGEGIWVHPHRGKLMVHLGEQICETVLMR